MLTEFRARLAVPGWTDVLLDKFLTCWEMRGCCGRGGLARTDSTHVIAAVRRLVTICRPT